MKINCNKCNVELSGSEDYLNRHYEICNKCSQIPVHGFSPWEFQEYESMVDTIIQCEYGKVDHLSERLKKAYSALYDAHREYADALTEQGFLVG